MISSSATTSSRPPADPVEVDIESRSRACSIRRSRRSRLGGSASSLTSFAGNGEVKGRGWEKGRVTG